MLVPIKSIFNPTAVAQSLYTMTNLNSTIMDTFFTARPLHPMPTIGLSELSEAVQTVPVVMRDGSPYPLSGGALDINFIAPQPIKTQINITASELNDLKLILPDAAAVEAWRQNKLEQIRRVHRDTTEAMCSTVLATGKISWLSYLEGGQTQDYTVDYGDVLQYAPATKLTTASTLGEIYALLQAMEEKIHMSGGGTNVSFLAGRDVVSVLLGMAQTYTSTVGGSPITLKLESGSMQIGSYSLTFMSEKYPVPRSNTWADKIPPKAILAVAKSSVGKVYYLATDSISANNAATPLHIHAVPRQDDSGIMLISQSKPLPVRNSKSVCVSTVLD